MVTRIRYKTHPKRENVVESVQTFTSSSTKAKYIVRLDLNNYTYEVKNINSEVIYRGGEKISNLNVLKRHVRNRLGSLGVSLKTEDRNRTFGICNKGYSQKKHLEDKYEGFGDVIGIES